MAGPQGAAGRVGTGRGIRPQADISDLVQRAVVSHGGQGPARWSEGSGRREVTRALPTRVRHC